MSLTGCVQASTRNLMGLFELSANKAPSGSPLYINHNTGDPDHPKAYLYRGDERQSDRTGLWMVIDEKEGIDENKGYIRSVQADADLPTSPGVTWIQAEGLVVTQVRLRVEL